MAQARRSNPAAERSYNAFREAIGVNVDDQTILSIVETEGADVVRACVNEKRRDVLITMLVSHCARETVVRLGTSSVCPETVGKVLRRVGWKAFSAELDVPHSMTLAQWVSEAESEGATGDTPLPPPAQSGTVHQMPRRQANTPGPASNGPRAAAPRPSAPAGTQGSQARTSGDSRDDAEDGESSQIYLQVKAHNKKREGDGQRTTAACQFDATVYKDRPVIKVEAAKGHPTFKDKYDWDNKIVFYTSAGELEIMLCVMLGYLPECRFGNHGEQNNKYLQFKRQPDSFYVVLGEGRNNSVATLIKGEACSRITALCLLQYQQQHFGLDGALLLTCLKNVAASFASAAPRGD